jgi:trehalose 6-phosphate synthase/phosphatase
MRPRPTADAELPNLVVQRGGPVRELNGRLVLSREAMGDRPAPGRVVMVSNRLPVTVLLRQHEVTLGPSSGGLATGLRDVHERGGSLWVGWSGVSAPVSPGVQSDIDRSLDSRHSVGVPLSAREVTGYYERYANAVLWPVLHDRTDLADVDPCDWATYLAVNEKFADRIARELRPGDRVWIHDYHLMLVPRLLRTRCPDALIGFFLHTPFPALASWAAIPQCATLLDGLLGADVVGFHTEPYAERFVESVRTVLGRSGTVHEVLDGERPVRVQSCPMSIDVDAFEARAASPEVARRVAQFRHREESLLVGVDRLDYSKGIPERLRAFACLLQRHEELHGRVRLLQLTVPSRDSLPAYRALRTEIEALVARINARFGTERWAPVEYQYRAVDPDTLVALYRAADVMLVTPLRDGMNLVAKEFVASRLDGDGVLVLSRHAGSASELGAALLVDPTDVDELASTCATALALSPAERRVRMRRLRGIVRRHDVHQWARACLISLSNDRASAVGHTAG